VGLHSGEYSQTYNVGNSLSYSVEGLGLGQSYYFAVIAIGSTGLESLPSAELVVTVAAPPLPMGSMVASNGSGQFDLQWTFPTAAMSSAPEFIVQASPDLVTWTQVATLLAENSLGGNGQVDRFSWPIPPAAGEPKFYRLTAKNWMGSSSAP